MLQKKKDGQYSNEYKENGNSLLISKEDSQDQQLPLEDQYDSEEDNNVTQEDKNSNDQDKDDMTLDETSEN